MEKQYPELTKNLASNPLPDVFHVTPDKAEDVDKLYNSLTGSHKSPIVAKVTDGKRLSHRILQVAHVIEVVFTLATFCL